MNPVAEEMRAIYNGEINDEELMHYGMPRRSGRYPWGSGDNPYQHSMDWLGRYETYKKQGYKESEIAELMGYFENGKPSSGKLRSAKANEVNNRDVYRIMTAKSLKADGLGPTEIGRRMGVSESTVRGWFKEEFENRARQAENTAIFIEDKIKKYGMVDIGKGVEKELGISKEMLNQALLMLEEEGYPVYKGGVPQPNNPGQQTNQKVICMPGTQHKEIYDYSRVHALNEEDYVSHDGGQTFDKLVYPKSLDSSRLKILLADEVGPDGETGSDKDGIVQLRRGVDDLSLGNDRYAQVRILVDNSKYIKGMAVYSDNLPDGVDVLFNSSKTSIEKALKDIKTDDPINPFGALIKAGGQSYYIDKDGNRQLSLINKKSSEGDWSEWKDALPSQFLSKQSLYMAEKQLNLAKADKAAEYDAICSLENPTIKKYYLKEFADNCEAAAVNLQAAALPGQKYHVIFPLNSLKDNEVYAPRYEDGTKLALIRYPHGGTFEIPILTVNNKNPTARELVGTDSVDAVCINKKNATILSGADFDGDTVMCIPTHDKAGKVKIVNTPRVGAYKELEDFDPRMSYPERDGMKYMTKGNTGTEMGKITNLITDMTLAHASPEEMVRAVKHSMVVIDANKHKLDYKRSEIENNIKALQQKYQPKYDEDGNLIGEGGAATIISRAKGETSVLKRQGTPKINMKGTDWYDPTKPEGSLVYKTADDLYKVTRTINKKTGIQTLTSIDGTKIKYDPSDEDSRAKYKPVEKKDPDTGETIFTNPAGTITYKTEPRTQPSTKMRETDDAYTLVSSARHPMELYYADYANAMKSMANDARKEMLNTGKVEYSAAAKKAYQAEYDSLMNKLNDAEKNSPRERAALRIANAEIAAKEKAYKEEHGINMPASDLKKIKTQAVNRGRTAAASVSRKIRNIIITDKEWEAIQAGAISESRLVRILANTDASSLRQRAMPKATNTLSVAQINRAKSLAASNYTLSQIAEIMGKSPSTISNYLRGGN